MDLSNKKTGMIVLIGILWIVITVLGWKEQYMAGMYLGIVLMLLHMMLGTAKGGKLSSKMIIYPFLIWALLWIVSFTLSKYYADIFAQMTPSFNILGLHPSFAWTILTYWIGGILTLTIGFILLKDEWLSEKDWQEFKEKIQMIEDKGVE